MSRLTSYNMTFFDDYFIYKTLITDGDSTYHVQVMQEFSVNKYYIKLK